MSKQKHIPSPETLNAEMQWSDNASAIRFIDRHEKDFRYVYSWEKWLAWDGKRWSLKAGKNRVGDAARTNATKAWTEAALHCEQRSSVSDQAVNFAKQANKKERIQAVIELAKFDQRVAISHDQLDADPYLFNCLNGTLEMNSGTFRPHQQEDLLTQVANVLFEPGAQCPLWIETLGHVFAGNQALIDYVQTLIGYSIVGITDEHILPINHGDGNNGKSTIWNAVADMLGDYAALVGQDLLMPNSDKHPTEMADLFGKRFVAVSEPERGRKLAESQVKEMTGDRILKARRMREDFWEFTPTHTFWLSTNHKPKITGTDAGIWRRIKLIPFTVDLSEVVAVDKSFPDKLLNEYSGILNWALEGWKRYQREGLIEPQAVTEATSEYRGAEDEIGRFIAETYVTNSAFITPAKEAFLAYVEWGGQQTKTAFGTELAKRFDKVKHTAGMHRDKVVYEGFGTS